MDHCTGSRLVSNRPARSLLSSAAVGLFTMFLATTASADMAPGPPPPDCVGKPDGSPCPLFNGTLGKCQSSQDSRRPGRTWVTCVSDGQECDRLPPGAPCHGYLGKTAHCKEFTNAEKKTTWRTCNVDGTDAAVAPDPGPAASDPSPATQPPPPRKKGMFSCSAAAGGAAGAGPLSLWAAALLFAARRRIRRAAT